MTDEIKFVKTKWKEANKARKDASKIGNFRSELYWQGKEGALMEVLKYLEGKSEKKK